MEGYILVGWPEVQKYMDLEGFEDNATLVMENPYMDIGVSTYLIDKEWADFVTKS